MKVKNETNLDVNHFDCLWRWQGVTTDDIASIRVEPAEVVLSASSDLPGTQTFVAYATLNNGDEISWTWSLGNLKSLKLEI